MIKRSKFENLLNDLSKDNLCLNININQTSIMNFNLLKFENNIINEDVIIIIKLELISSLIEKLNSKWISIFSFEEYEDILDIKINRKYMFIKIKTKENKGVFLNSAIYLQYYLKIISKIMSIFKTDKIKNYIFLSLNIVTDLPLNYNIKCSNYISYNEIASDYISNIKDKYKINVFRNNNDKKIDLMISLDVDKKYFCIIEILYDLYSFCLKIPKFSIDCYSVVNSTKYDIFKYDKMYIDLTIRNNSAIISIHELITSFQNFAIYFINNIFNIDDHMILIFSYENRYNEIKNDIEYLESINFYEYINIILYNNDERKILIKILYNLINNIEILHVSCYDNNMNQIKRFYNLNKKYLSNFKIEDKRF